MFLFSFDSRSWAGCCWYACLPSHRGNSNKIAYTNRTNIQIKADLIGNYRVWTVLFTTVSVRIKLLPRGNSTQYWVHTQCRFFSACCRIICSYCYTYTLYTYDTARFVCFFKFFIRFSWLCVYYYNCMGLSRNDPISLYDTLNLDMENATCGST